MLRTSSIVIAIIFFTLPLVATDPCSQTRNTDLSQLYDQALLKQWQPRFQAMVERMVKDEIEPELTDAQQRLLRQAPRIFPLVGHWNGPFDYYADGTSIKIPVLSVKFLYDLILADIWLQSNGYQTASILQYVNMLKYKGAASFPDHRYPTPLSALGIPISESAEAHFQSPAAQHEFEYAFHGALLFVLGHEVGHIVLEHQSSSVQNEIEADGIGIALLGRAGADPASLMLFFLYSSTWVTNAADCSTLQEYQTWIAHSDHPLNGFRITTVGNALASHPEVYFPDLPATDERIQLTIQIGQKLIGTGRRLDDLMQQRLLRQHALETTLSDLKPRK